MKNDDVAYEFVNNMNVLDGHAEGSNFFFEGDTLYSYGRHYPLAIKLFDGERVEFLLNSTGYSKTTERRHTSCFRRASAGYKVWETRDCDVAGIHDHTRHTIEEELTRIANARSNLPYYIRYIQRELDIYTAFCKRFQLKPFYTPLFAKMSDHCIARMRRGCLYNGKSNFKLFRSFSEVMQVTEVLTRGAT